VLAGRYTLLSQLGSGGLGEVWVAEDQRLQKRVAVKSLKRADATVIARFRQEALATASLDHPHIVRVLDYFVEAEAPYIVMELLEGASLSELVNAMGKLDARRAASLAAQVASGLDFAHSKGIIHRDVKPANVQVVAHPSGGESAKLLDFGIAKLFDATTLTAAGSTLGTPAFMAPEQVVGGDVDARTDVYALGVTLYFALAGRLPYRGQGTREILAQITSGSHQPLRTLRPDVDSQLEHIVARAMSCEPAMRPATAGELRRELERWLSVPEAPHVPTLPSADAGTPAPMDSGPTIYTGPSEPGPAVQTTAATMPVSALAAAGGTRRGSSGVVVAGIAIGVLGLGAVVVAAGVYALRDQIFAAAPTEVAPPSTTTVAPEPSPREAPVPAPSASAVAPSTSAVKSASAPKAPSPAPKSPAPAKKLDCKERTQCGDKCVATSFDPNNCGACGKKCAATDTCAAGTCTPCASRPFHAVCSGKCIDVGIDAMNCGSCGNRCSVGHMCAMGQCK